MRLPTTVRGHHTALGLLAMGALGVGGMGDTAGHGAGMVGMHQHLGAVAATWHLVLVGLAVAVMAVAML